VRYRGTPDITFQGDSPRPEWAVALSVRLSDDQARVVATLLHGPIFSQAIATKDSTFDLGDRDYALLELPRADATSLVTDFGPRSATASR
jgi:hypothetical protein